MFIVLLCLTDSSTGAVSCTLARRVLNDKRKEQGEDELGRGRKHSLGEGELSRKLSWCSPHT